MSSLHILLLTLTFLGLVLADNAQKSAQMGCLVANGCLVAGPHASTSTTTQASLTKRQVGAEVYATIDGEVVSWANNWNGYSAVSLSDSTTTQSALPAKVSVSVETETVTDFITVTDFETLHAATPSSKSKTRKSRHSTTTSASHSSVESSAGAKTETSEEFTTVTSLETVKITLTSTHSTTSESLESPTSWSILSKESTLREPTSSSALPIYTYTLPHSSSSTLTTLLSTTSSSKSLSSHTSTSTTTRSLPSHTSTTSTTSSSSSSSAATPTSTIDPYTQPCNFSTFVSDSGFEIDFDNYSPSNTSDTLTYYHNFFWADGYTFKSASQQPYEPYTLPYVVEYCPPADLIASDRDGLIGSGPNFQDQTWQFTAYSMRVGCLSPSPDDTCVFRVSGYRPLSTTSTQSTLGTFQHFNVSGSGCATADQSACTMSYLYLDSTAFSSLSDLRIEARVSRTEEKISFVLDDLFLGWDNVTCKADEVRAKYVPPKGAHE